MASHRIGMDSWLSRTSDGSLSEHTSDGFILRLDDDGSKVLINGSWEERCYPTGKGMRMNKKAGKNEICECNKETGRLKLGTCKAIKGFNMLAMMNMLMGMGQNKKKGSADEAAAAEEAKHGGAFRTEALPEGTFNDL